MNGANGNPGDVLDACERLEENIEDFDGMVSSLVLEHRRIYIWGLLREDRCESCTQSLHKDEMVQQVPFELNRPAQCVPALADSGDCTEPLLPSEKEQLRVLAVMKDIADARCPNNKSYLMTIRKLQKEVMLCTLRLNDHL